jgi:(hydroxyamino)benzene mutase
MNALTQSRSRHVLLQGLLLVMAGLLWGFVVSLTPFPRLALVAHIQFMVNGLLLIALATLLLKLPHQVGPRSAGAMVMASWLIWPMVLSQAANAWWGTNQVLPLAAQQAGATGGAAWQELAMKATHLVAGLALAVAWGLLVAGFVKQPAAAGP